MRKRHVLAAAVGAVLAGQLVMAVSSDGAVSGSCSHSFYGLCEYWGTSYDGSHTMIYNVAEVPNLPISGSTSYVYLSSGSGQGQYLGNNNGSVRNYADTSVNLYYNTNYSGPELTLSQWNSSGSGNSKAGNAQGSLLNNLRSFTFGIP